MCIEDKKTIWEILNKYDGILVAFCNSLSKLLQSSDTPADYWNIFGVYQLIDKDDLIMIDRIFGKKILYAINQ